MSSSFDISERLRIQGDDGPNAQMRARATQHQQHFTDSASSERIFCTLNGPLSTSIWVLDKRDNPTSIEPYLQLTAEGTSTWHAISQTPMTKPPVPSILVRVHALEYWEDEWLLCHRGHSEPNWQLTADPQYGMLPGYGERPCLLRCCGTDRPRGKTARLVVKPLKGRDFVSVHDYLTTVHPWLMSFRGDILEYMGLWKGKPAEEESVLMLSNFVGPLVVLGQTRGVRSWSERLRVISNLIDAVLGQQDTLRQGNLHSCVGKCQCNVLTGGAEMSSGWK
ncbi:hypothetical protein V501_06908 [Pseudogymnoascus sp. VKM F-4519 (FW-2642)]|nr:hypothetical protein V501_06908 [Pseudogymnoascus sp. VKM F-4519 (FW-2642)]